MADPKQAEAPPPRPEQTPPDLFDTVHDPVPDEEEEENMREEGEPFEGNFA
jgi:hypothetical protein